MFVKDKITDSTNAPRSSYTKYEDPMGDFSSKELKYSLWFVKNKLLLYKVALGLLIGISVLEWGYSLGALGVYAVVGWQRDRALTRSLTQFVDYTQFYARTAPQPVAVLGTQVLPGGVHKYDAVSELVNPNKQFTVQFDYYFMVGSAATPRTHATLLAGQDTLIPAFGINSDVYPGEASLVLENISWKRVDTDITADPLRYQAARLDFEVKNFQFISALSPESAKTNIIRFDYTNKTPFSYKEPSFVVGLYKNQSLVGVLPLVLPSFVTVETKSLDLRSFVDNLDVDEVKMFPAINIYDHNAYLPPPS